MQIYNWLIKQHVSALFGHHQGSHLYSKRMYLK